MPKAKKTEKESKTLTTSTQEVLEEPVIKVETLSTKKSSKKSTSTPVTVAPPQVVETPVNEVNEVNELVENDSHQISIFSEFMAKLQIVTGQLNNLKTDFRILEKKYNKELKVAQKLQAKKKRKNNNRSPSGFVKPTLISSELAVFLNKPEGTEMARTEVTREINGYIRAHNLQDKNNGRKINPDLSLATLLKIENGEELTYFNLQRYMSPHFAKAGQALPTAGQSVSTSS